MKKFALYAHGGSGNHGCEALVRTIYSLLPKDAEIKVFTKNAEEDGRYINDLKIDFVPCGIVPSKKTLSGFISAVKIKLFKKKYAFVKPAYKSLLDFADKDTVAISIGGDNYCYDGFPEVLAILNKELHKKKAKTVLLGCSIEPELLKDKNKVEDLSRYDFITARETITFDALVNAGVKTDISLFPDSAFCLPTGKIELPKGFIDGNTVGINISPLVVDYSEKGDLLFNAYSKVIEYILNQTDMSVALIPHVVWEDNDDRKAIKVLHEKFKDNERVVVVGDDNAVNIKGYISRCRFFIGARTHSTIAAYSTCVPTLVVGYSVKSKGIARDLFGDEKDYVVPISAIKSGDEILNGFKFIVSNESEIKSRLKETSKIQSDRLLRLKERLNEI